MAREGGGGRGQVPDGPRLPVLLMLFAPWLSLGPEPLCIGKRDSCRQVVR